MKIYELRDITDEEVYYTKMYCETKAKAIEELTKIKQDIASDPSCGDYVIGAIYEHEVGVWEHEKLFAVKIFEIQYTNSYNEEKDEYFWERKITYERKTDESLSV